MNKIGIGTVISAIALIWTIGSYAMDWQRDQDKKINDIDKLITRQQALLEYQVKYNENLINLYNNPQNQPLIFAPNMGINTNPKVSE